MAEQTKSAVDAMKEIRQELGNEHTQALATQAKHLCLCSMRDVGIIVAALGVGMALGRIGVIELGGRWRVLPYVVGGSCLIAARFVPPERLRFVTRSSMVVGGSALLLSTVHYTLQASLEELRNMEA